VKLLTDRRYREQAPPTQLPTLPHDQDTFYAHCPQSLFPGIAAVAALRHTRQRRRRLPRRQPAQQAKLLQDWAAQPDPARIELVDALQQGQLTVNGETKTVRLNNRLRG
jgi:hypothetical protein